MSYSVPTNELTLSDMKGYRTAAVEAGISRAMSLGIARVREELVVRDALPFTDFGAPAGNGWLTEQYITFGGVPTAGAWISAFSSGALPLNVPQLARTKIAVFYGWADTMANPICVGVRFRVGANGATTKAVFLPQMAIDAKMEPDSYFTEPVVYDPEDFVYIELYGVGVATPAGGEVTPFRCLIIERVGGTVS